MSKLPLRFNVAAPLPKALKTSWSCSMVEKLAVMETLETRVSEYQEAFWKNVKKENAQEISLR